MRHQGADRGLRRGGDRRAVEAGRARPPARRQPRPPRPRRAHRRARRARTRRPGPRRVRLRHARGRAGGPGAGAGRAAAARGRRPRLAAARLDPGDPRGRGRPGLPDRPHAPAGHADQVQDLRSRGPRPPVTGRPVSPPSTRRRQV
ncbi:hypothetical protein SBRY_40714 [Actinacidiphila bryophytorum]|uniref:Uncharacterized protein n=1 Tax=Actinacidiphila bryophytorum TaxID=1436133 RepID=A0A9W4MHG0_9ACTN|nr:hypothetical protein SBRY_40714 [Actinacidiphila bryophytorum]